MPCRRQLGGFILTEWRGDRDEGKTEYRRAGYLPSRRGLPGGWRSTPPLLVPSARGGLFLDSGAGADSGPFFFMVTGQFVLSDSLFSGREGDGALFRQVKKLALLYGLSILLYLPVGIYAGHYQALTCPLPYGCC